MKIIHLTQIREGNDFGEEKRIATAVNVDGLRCFYPRHDDKPGTRLTFLDGGGFAVAESFDQVLAQVQPQ